MNNSSWIWGIVVVVIVVVGGWFLLKGGSAPTQSGPVKLGVVLPLTGEAGDIGSGDRAAVELAVDEINKAGGVNGQQITVDYQDGACNAQAASNAASKLINEGKVVAIIGG